MTIAIQRVGSVGGAVGAAGGEGCLDERRMSKLSRVGLRTGCGVTERAVRGARARSGSSPAGCPCRPCAGTTGIVRVAVLAVAAHGVDRGDAVVGVDLDLDLGPVGLLMCA